MVRRAWTQEEIEILSRMYYDHFAKEIATILGRCPSSIYEKAAKLGLKSSEEKIRRGGMLSASNPKTIASRFTKGHIPDNKGKKLSPEVYAKVARTMFKQGNEPVNRRKIGSERVNVNGYLEIKVAEPNIWRLKHRVIWEQHNGSIPEGFNIQFKNHNPLDCRIENLYIISKSEQMKTENSLLARYPKELQDVIRLKGAINRQIRKQEQNGE